MIGTKAASRLVVLLGLLVVAGCSTLSARAPSPAPQTDSGFCARAQREIVASSIASNNEVYSDYDAFVKSKPAIRPLTLRQYVERVDGEPRAIFCKMKTADHLLAEYGPLAAGADVGCDGVNRRHYEQVLASFDARERRKLRFDRGRKVIFEPDWMTPFGPDWLAAYPFVRVDDGGALHVQAKAMRNEWNDPRYFDAPVNVRGTRYCRLVAPEYLRRLLQGVDTLP
jgi:hypothetical protein